MLQICFVEKHKRKNGNYSPKIGFSEQKKQLGTERCFCPDPLLCCRFFICIAVTVNCFIIGRIKGFLI